MIYVDASAFLARYLSADRHHAQALKAFLKIQKNNLPIATSPFAIEETLTLLSRHTPMKFTEDIAQGLLHSKALTVMRAEPDDEWEALAWFKKFGGQGVRFKDCLSFALMKRHQIKKALAFCGVYSLVGFEHFS
ncbi:MAG: PIN domain-containing protein [Acidobacteria bacterium]|nr:PIN domain-containing protein [Acidobacteriota bacterium]